MSITSEPINNNNDLQNYTLQVKSSYSQTKIQDKRKKLHLHVIS